MLFKCSTGPLRIPKDPMNVKLPKVNDKANFCGRMASMGTPTKNASAKKRADRKRRPQKTCGKRGREQGSASHSQECAKCEIDMDTMWSIPNATID